MLSIVKPTVEGNNTVIRVYNPYDSITEDEIKFNFDFKTVWEAFMSEEVKKNAMQRTTKSR